MLINLRRLQTSKHTRSLYLSYSFGLLNIRKGGPKSHNMTIGTALLVQNESSLFSQLARYEPAMLFKRLRGDVRTVVHAIELDDGHRLVRAGARFGDVASAAYDAKHPAAICYKLCRPSPLSRHGRRALLVLPQLPSLQ